MLSPDTAASPADGVTKADTFPELACNNIIIRKEEKKKQRIKTSVRYTPMLYYRAVRLVAGWGGRQSKQFMIEDAGSSINAGATAACSLGGTPTEARDG